VVELDGAAGHETRRAFESDRERDAALVAAGFRSLRYTWRRVVREPEAVMREVRSALTLGR
jgi:very-short-patch-repair endonuclease